jgi:hypothetical protein
MTIFDYDYDDEHDDEHERLTGAILSQIAERSLALVSSRFKSRRS